MFANGALDALAGDAGAAAAAEGAVLGRASVAAVEVGGGEVLQHMKLYEHDFSLFVLRIWSKKLTSRRKSGE
jgi:hypothetical protein